MRTTRCADGHALHHPAGTGRILAHEGDLLVKYGSITPDAPRAVPRRVAFIDRSVGLVYLLFDDLDALPVEDRNQAERYEMAMFFAIKRERLF